MRTRSVLCSFLLCLLVSHSHAAQERYYAISINGAHVGYSHEIATLTPEGRKIVSDSLVKISLMGTEAQQSVQGITLYTPEGKRLLRSTIAIRLNDNKPMTIDCRFHDGKVELLTSAITGDTKRTFPWTQGCYFLGGDTDAECNRLAHALPPGKNACTVKYLDILTQTVATILVKRVKPQTLTLGNKKQVCDVYAVESASGELQFAISRTTHLVAGESRPAQKVEIRLADRTAMNGLHSYEAIAHAFAITDAALPDPMGMQSLKIKIDGVISLEKVTPELLQTPTQKFTGTVQNGHIQGVLDIHALRYTGENTPPFTGKPDAAPELATYVRPGPYVESDDPEIMALAKKITEGAKTRWDAVKAIGKWVHENISYVVTGSGAKACLTTKKGDCGPHTWLSIALCRAAGIPARSAGGALYTDMLGGSFGQHYWTRVYMGKDGWIPIDTTSGEIGSFSPTHLTFWNLGAITSLSVKIVDYSPKNSPTVASAVRLPRTPLTVHVGDVYHYTEHAEGKFDGEETVECVGIDSHGGNNLSNWKFAAHLNVTQQSAPMKVAMEGTFAVTDTAEPVRLTLHSDANGVSQSATYTFDPKAVHASIGMGSSSFPRETKREGNEFMLLSVLASHLSLATQTLHIAPGQKVTVPFFLADNLQRMELVFTAQPKTETIHVGDRDVECVVCDGSTGTRYWLARDTGALLRVYSAAAKMTVERK